MLNPSMPLLGRPLSRCESLTTEVQQQGAAAQQAKHSLFLVCKGGWADLGPHLRFICIYDSHLRKKGMGD